MIKITGMILVLVSSSIIGYLYSLKYKMRKQVLKSLINSINLFKIELVYSRAPINEVLEHVVKTSDYMIKDIFKQTVYLLNLNEGYTAGEAWKKSIEKCNLDYLKKSDKEVLITFGHSLGNTDLYNQEKNFNLVLEKLKHQLDNAEKEGEKNEKLYKNIGFLTGLGIVILLL